MNNTCEAAETSGAAQVSSNVNFRVFYVSTGIGTPSFSEERLRRTWDYQILEKTPTQEQFKSDFVEVWSGSFPRAGADDLTHCEALFSIFNDYGRNPLSAENGGQGRLRKLIPEQAHTSMSVGDIVTVDGKAYQVRGCGFEAIEVTA